VPEVSGVALRRSAQRWLRTTAPGRWGLAGLAMGYVAVTRRRRCRVRPSGDHWVHEWSTGVITDLILTSRPPEDWDADTRDVAFHRYAPRVGDVALDVGAGVGHETRLLSRLVGDTGRVVAIEANPRVYRCLVDMVERNGLRNVTCLHVAVNDVAGTVHFADAEDHLGNALSTTGTVEVVATTLDAVVQDLGLERVDFLKMNIEGAERPALRGMRATLPRVAHACISCHDFLADAGGDPATRTSADVRALLTAAGMTVEDRRDPRPWVADYLYGSR